MNLWYRCCKCNTPISFTNGIQLGVAFVGKPDRAARVMCTSGMVREYCLNCLEQAVLNGEEFEILEGL